MVTRRRALRIGLTTGTFAVAGCLSLLGGDWKALEITNRDSTAHTVAVTAEGDFQPQEIERDVEADGTAAVEEFVPELDYPHVVTITVRIDGTTVTEVRRRISVDYETFEVVISGPDDVAVEPTSAAVSTPTEQPPGATNRTAENETTTPVEPTSTSEPTR